MGELKMEMGMLIGLPGSGKSTFFCMHFAATYEHISKDRLRNDRHPARRQGQLIEEALQAQRFVVIDNTNPTVTDREPLIRLGQMYDARVVGYSFESQGSQCLERSRQCTGKVWVPDVAIYVTAKKLAKSS
jgi:predicted kinase